MADDVGERLVVMLEARISEFEKRMAKAEQTGTRTYRQLTAGSSRASRQMANDMAMSAGAINKALASTSTQIGAFGKTMGIAFGAALAVKGAQTLVDTATRIDNALKVAGLSGDDLTKVYNSLFESAQKNAAPLESLVQLYGRVSMVQKELGASTKEMLKFTDNVAVALRVSGKTAAESSGALLQLSQALGSGVVRAEEFNSMLEGALPIVQAAARGIDDAGGSVSKLRKLVNDGKVSSKAFFKGFQAGAVTLNQQVAGASLTVAQGFTRLENAAVDAAKRVNDAAGISKSATSTLDALAIVVTRLGDAFAYLAKKGSESNAAKQIDDLGVAARNLWNDPSWKNLYAFLFDTSGSRATAAANDAITNRINGINALRKAMQDANAEATKGQAKKSGEPNRFDDAFSQFATKKVKLSDFPVKDDKNKDGGADRDAFERRMAMTQRQIDLMGVEARTIDQTVEARERARIVVELETAAKRANEDAGKKNTAVTEEQRAKINQLADAYAKAKGQLEQLNGPLASFARESANVGQALETVTVRSLDRIGDEFADVVTGTKSISDAFRDMTASILRDLAKLMIKQAVLGPIAGLLGGGSGGGLLSSLLGGPSTVMVGNYAMPKFASGTNFAPGGPALINENGGEIVNLPRGSQVIPHDVSMAMARNSEPQRIEVAVTVDRNGNLDAYVKNVAQQTTAAGVRAALNSPQFVDRVASASKKAGSQRKI
ncbi:MAG: tape measure protein [Xanthobacteraceae bacterium]|nr:tape measure protein [Xanthobacteraceae bacterium]